MPAYLPVTAATVNYAPVVFVAFVAIASLWYFVWGRKNYAGPPKEEVADVEVAVRRQSDAHFDKRGSEKRITAANLEKNQNQNQM